MGDRTMHSVSARTLMSRQVCIEKKAFNLQSFSESNLYIFANERMCECVVWRDKYLRLEHSVSKDQRTYVDMCPCLAISYV